MYSDDIEKEIADKNYKEIYAELMDEFQINET